MPSYPWLRVFQQAIDENDLSRLHQRVLDAENAIVTRMQELASSDEADVEAHTELQQIRSALTGLLRIKSQRLKWPMTGFGNSDSESAS